MESMFISGYVFNCVVGFQGMFKRIVNVKIVCFDFSL